MIRITSYAPSLLALLCLILIENLPANASLFYCSKTIYDVLMQQDCHDALRILPTADLFDRYFVEQQLTTGPQQADWSSWSDIRPETLRQKIVQTPKFWSYGTCNLALLSYTEGPVRMSVSFTTWAAVFIAGRQLLQTCGILNGQGGAATIDGAHNAPALTIFMWKNGAIFETVLNRYTSAAFPAGVDPRHPASLQVFSSNGSASPLSNSSNAESLSALQDGFVNGSIAVAGSTSTTALPLDTA